MAAAKTRTTVTRKVVEEPTVETTEKKSDVRKHNPDDLIPCRSIISGKLYIRGSRSDFLYTWADYDDVVDIEFRDVDYMIRSNDKNVYEPRIIIEDDEIVDSYPRLKDLYDALYTVDDLKEIINMDSYKMEQYIEKLPNGAKNAIKGLASSMIESGQLDSVSRIKTLDSIFGTQMLLTLAQE